MTSHKIRSVGQRAEITVGIGENSLFKSKRWTDFGSEGGSRRVARM